MVYIAGKVCISFYKYMCRVFLARSINLSWWLLFGGLKGIFPLLAGAKEKKEIEKEVLFAQGQPVSHFGNFYRNSSFAN